MRALIHTCFALMLSASACAQAITAIEDVNVIPMNKEVIWPHQTVLIQGQKILQAGDQKSVKVPAGAQKINGKGKYLIPGLFDMHAHFFYEQGNNHNTCEAELGMMLAKGLTTSRIQCGDSVYLEARQQVRSGSWTGPELFVSSPQFVGAWPWPGKVFAMVCKSPEDAQKAVRRCKKAGYDEIKITFMVKRDVYDAIINTAREEGMKVTGHVGPLVKLPAALAAGQQIEHMDEFIDMLLPDTSYNHGQSVSDMNIWRKKAWETVMYLDESKIPALVQMVKAAGIAVTPTNYFFFSSFADSIPKEQYMHRPDYAYMPSDIKEDRWEVRDHYWKSPPSADKRARYKYLRRRITSELWKAGVPLMAGSDSPEWFLVQGFSIHDELNAFVEAGLSPYAALEAATKNPAVYLGIYNRVGSIEAGKEADLLLLDKNPLQDISNTRTISGVMVNGAWYDQKAINALLQSAKDILGK